MGEFRLPDTHLWGEEHSTTQGELKRGALLIT